MNVIEFEDLFYLLDKPKLIVDQSNIFFVLQIRTKLSKHKVKLNCIYISFLDNKHRLNKIFFNRKEFDLENKDSVIIKNLIKLLPTENRYSDLITEFINEITNYWNLVEDKLNAWNRIMVTQKLLNIKNKYLKLIFKMFEEQVFKTLYRYNKISVKLNLTLDLTYNKWINTNLNLKISNLLSNFNIVIYNYLGQLLYKTISEYESFAVNNFVLNL